MRREMLKAGAAALAGLAVAGTWPALAQGEANAAGRRALSGSSSPISRGARPTCSCVFWASPWGRRWSSRS
ncbi:hypothetical protein D9599_29500 [Roseomonas sp. KE2513]|nr:hypothetical protein [Roseomonas sp. KE2513]